MSRTAIRGLSPAVHPPTGVREEVRGRRRESEVLAAALKVFHEKTYAEASVQDVADELGILKGSLYHYISSKEDLLVWLLSAVQDDVTELLQGAIAEGGTPLEQLERYIRRQVEYNARNIARISVYHHDQARLGPERGAAFQARRRPLERILVNLVKDAQAAGEVPADLDPRALTHCAMSTVVGVHRWYKPGSRLRIADLVELTTGYAMAGLRHAAD